MFAITMVTKREGQRMTKTEEHIVFGIVAHVDAGKTTLSERMLFESGMIRRQGSVDRRDTVLDTFAMEKERGITIYSKEARISLPGQEWYLIDTPGHVDFSAEMERALGVLDYAVLVVSAVEGIQAHTRTLWSLLEQYDIPVFLFVNKTDLTNADVSRTLMELRHDFSDRCIDFSQGDTERLYDALGMCTEEAMELLLEQGTLEDDFIAEMIAQRQVFPVLAGSAQKGVGVDRLLAVLNRFGRQQCGADEEETMSGKVFKISRDESGNRLTHMKITGGKLVVKAFVGTEKADQIRVYSGEKYTTVHEAIPGMVVCVTGLAGTYPGQGFGREEQMTKAVLEPVLTYRMILPAGCDPVTWMMPRLAQLEEENPQLKATWDETAGQLLVHVMGEVELEVLTDVIEKRFGVRVSFGEGRILYKETIEDTVEGVGHFEPLRHYAEVHLILEPLPLGSGMEFELRCSEDVLDRNWQRLIMTHLTERKIRGVLTGSELTDVRISVCAGRAHPKHTEGGDFRQATYRAVRQGLMQTTSTLLEPLYSFRIAVSADYIGRVMTDVESFGGQTRPPEYQGDRVILTGTAPVRKMQNYYRELLAFTKGEGSMQTQMAGYAPCPDAEEIIREIGYDPLADLRNTPDSVFCANGSGFVVPWDEVFAHMHVESVLAAAYARPEPETAAQKAAGTNGALARSFLSPDEVDRIIAGISRKDAGPEKAAGWKGKGRRATGYGAAGDSSVSRPGKKPKEKYLLVDGYNVVFAWKRLKELGQINIDGARDALLDEMCNYAAIARTRLLVVFDAYRIREHASESMKYHNIEVVYTAQDVTADMFIESFVHKNRERYEISVVTSDRLEQITVRSQGGFLISSQEFERLVHEAEKSLMEEYRKETQKEESFQNRILIPESLQNLEKP